MSFFGATGTPVIWISGDVSLVNYEGSSVFVPITPEEQLGTTMPSH